MFLINIKNGVIPSGQRSGIIRDENIFRPGQRLLLKEVKSIKRLSADKNERLLTFMQNNIL